MEESQQDLGVSKLFWELNVTGMKRLICLQQEPKDPDLWVTPTKSTQEAPQSIGTWDVHGNSAQL